MSNAQQLALWKAPKSERKISLDDFLYECEQRAIEREKIERNGGNVALQERFCDCPELLLNGKRLPCPPRLRVLSKTIRVCPAGRCAGRCKLIEQRKRFLEARQHLDASLCCGNGRAGRATVKERRTIRLKLQI